MSQNTSISLGDHFVEFVSEQVSSGRYATTSDVVRSGLRLLEEREAKLTVLRQTLVAGEQSGPARPFDLQAFVAKQKKLV
jgi:antitoxin ParD1/3/4